MIFVLDTSRENIFMGLYDEKAKIWTSQNEFLGGRCLNALIVTEYDKTLSQSTDGQNLLNGIIVAAGPGSFTGLRIGISFMNAIAYAKDIPIVAVEDAGDFENLLQKGLNVLKSAGSNFESAAVPSYGAEPHITKPKQ